MASKVSWPSALLLLLATLFRSVIAGPIQLANGEQLSSNVARLDTSATTEVLDRSSNWPYLSRRQLLPLLPLLLDSDDQDSDSPTLEARNPEPKHKPKHAKTTLTTTSSTANSTSATSTTSTEGKSTTTLLPTTKKSTAKTSTTEKSTDTKQTSTTTKKSTTTATAKSTTDKSSTTEKKSSTTEKSSKTDKSITTKKSSTTEKSTKKTTTTKSAPTVTHTVTVGSTTLTLTVEPTTIATPTASETLLSSSIIVPTATATPTGPPPPPPPPGKRLKIAIKNDITSTKAVHAYLTGLNPSGQLVMLSTDGEFYVPSTKSSTPVNITANVALPLSSGTTNHFTLPDYLSSARVWFAEGELQFAEVATSYGVGLVEPTIANIHDASQTVRWGFAEFTYGRDDGLYANLSFVDFVGLAIGMNLTSSTKPQAAPGIHKNGTAEICKALKEQSEKDGQPWDKLCQLNSDGELMRVLSPSSYLNINPSAFHGYFDDYVNQVWEKYASEPLYIESQNSLGQISCSVSSDSQLLTCEGDNRGYAKPSASDVFSCDGGPFAIEGTDNDVHLAVVPRLCAAFNRATLLVPGGNLQPSLLPKNYYTVTPNNFYSKFVHAAEINGEGYAFPYDDVAPTGKTNVAGLVASPDPRLLTLTVAGLGHLSSAKSG